MEAVVVSSPVMEQIFVAKAHFHFTQALSIGIISTRDFSVNFHSQEQVAAYF